MNSIFKHLQQVLLEKGLLNVNLLQFYNFLWKIALFLFSRCENIMTCPMKEIGSGQEHCPYDWLAVHDGKDENAPMIGQFCGMGKFPFSIIGNILDLFNRK